MSRLSVIIPATKKLSVIESLLKQSVEDIEILCVVPDGSEEDISETAGSDSIRIVNSDKRSVGELLNKGISEASGDYVCFLRPDFELLDYSLESIVNKLNRYDLDVIRYAYVAVDPDTDTTVDYNDCLLRKIRPGDFHRAIDLLDPVINKVNKEVWSGIYRRSYLIDNGIFLSDSDYLFDRAFYYETYGKGGLTYICRDMLYKVEVKDDIEAEVAGYASRLQEMKRIDGFLYGLDLDRVDFDRILGYEYEELYSWTSFYAGLTDYRDKIIEDTRTYISGVPYRFIRNYLKRFDGMVEKIPTEVPEELPLHKYGKISFYHEKCDAPKVSVVIPTYNQEEYLNEALASLTTQTLEEMEFICVNDGSTDKCMTIYYEYANIDKRFTLIDKANSGYGHSMNVGIDASTGEYLGILEPDDYVVPNMFADLYKIAKAKDLDLIKADFNRFVVNPDGSTTSKRNNLSNDKSYYNRVLCPGDEQKTFLFIMNTWSGIYSMAFLNKWKIRHNETPGASYQDNGFWFQTFIRAKKAYFVDKPYYMNRRDNPNSSMFSKGKFYCVTNEYKFIWEILEKDPELAEKFEQIFYRKKFGNFLTTYYRIAADCKKQYLEHFRDEFLPLMQGGLLDREWYDDNSWTILSEIIEQGGAYWDKIRVSVIMPVYNAEEWIRDCLDSIFAKDEVHTECICVDDGSTDNTLSILREYEEKDYRIKVITQENGGAGKARNNGMQYASGEYWMFLDCDDVFEADTLRMVYNFSHCRQSDITVFRSNQFATEVYKASPMQYTIKPEWLPAEQPFAGTDIKDNIFAAFVGWPWDKMFRADFIKETGLTFQEQRTTNDLLFVFSSIVKAERIFTMNTVLAHHRRLTDSLSVTREKSWFCFYDALCALKKQLIEWDLYDRFERDFISYSLNFSLWNLNSLKGEAYYKLYEKLTTEWWDNLGVTGKPEYYFYNSIDYVQYQQVLSMSAEDYLYLRFDQNQQKVQALNTSNTNNLKKFKDSEKVLQNTKKDLQKVKKDLDNAKKELQKTKKELNTAKGDLKNIKESKSYKLTSKMRKVKKKISGK